VLIAAIAVPASAQRSRIDPAAILRDPLRDSAAPAGQAYMRIPVNGSHINGALQTASGTALHATVLLLHGFVGYEGMQDVGEALRRAGLNVLAIHYRGAWGSEGTFTFGGSVDDAQAALQWLRDPAIAAQYHIDTTRIYVIGHSFGGFVATMLAARTHDVKAVAYISGWDIGTDLAPALSLPRDTLAAALAAASSAWGTSGAALAQEVIDHAADYRLTAIAPRIADRPILMTYARFEQSDNDPRTNFEPLHDALVLAGATRLTTRAFASDHGYADARIALSTALAQWLARVDAPVRQAAEHR
jgi:pimeloyl-ACP methyl ester carboxylesterase